MSQMQRDFRVNVILFGRRETTVRTVLPETLFVKKNEQLKLEYLDSNIYQVISKYVEIEREALCHGAHQCNEFRCGHG